jgi:hypothetical protein
MSQVINYFSSIKATFGRFRLLLVDLGHF